MKKLKLFTTVDGSISNKHKSEEHVRDCVRPKPASRKTRKGGTNNLVYLARERTGGKMLFKEGLRGGQ
jgi:hypothetical protein